MENKNENKNESNSAKKIRMLGVDSSEDIHLESDKEVKGNVVKNFWYRNKWFVVIGAVFLVVFIILAIQLLHKDEYDMKIVYAGPEYILTNVPDYSEKLKYAFDDHNGDGEKLLGFATIRYQTDAQREALVKNNEREKLISSDANLNALTQFETQIMSGEVCVYLIDPYLYEKRAKLACVSLSEIMGGEVDSNIVYDENAIYFKRTEFASYLGFNELPDDTLLCIVQTVGTDDELMENSKEFFKKIVNFSKD